MNRMLKQRHAQTSSSSMNLAQLWYGLRVGAPAQGEKQQAGAPPWRCWASYFEDPSHVRIREQLHMAIVKDAGKGICVRAQVQSLGGLWKRTKEGSCGVMSPLVVVSLNGYKCTSVRDSPMMGHQVIKQLHVSAKGTGVYCTGFGGG